MIKHVKLSGIVGGTAVTTFSRTLKKLSEEMTQCLQGDRKIDFVYVSAIMYSEMISSGVAGFLNSNNSSVPKSYVGGTIYGVPFIEDDIICPGEYEYEIILKELDN